MKARKWAALGSGPINFKPLHNFNRLFLEQHGISTLYPWTMYPSSCHFKFFCNFDNLRINYYPKLGFLTYSFLIEIKREYGEKNKYCLKSSFLKCEKFQYAYWINLLKLLAVRWILCQNDTFDFHRRLFGVVYEIYRNWLRKLQKCLQVRSGHKMLRLWQSEKSVHFQSSYLI